MGVGLRHAVNRLFLAAGDRSSSMGAAVDVPRGHLPVYVGNSRRRFVIPVSYLNHAAFQELLQSMEEETGFIHPMGGLTIRCEEDDFLNLTAKLRTLPSAKQ